MVRILALTFLAALLLTACTGGASARNSTDTINVRVFRSPTCSCCGAWVEYMEQNGFNVMVEDVLDMAPIKARYQVPPELQSCHTAIVDGFVIEGHVPVREILRLIAERPDVIGLAVPGMPAGAPGMEGTAQDPFDVIAFDDAGQVQIFAQYPDN
jgi:hypothetical protein